MRLAVFLSFTCRFFRQLHNKMYSSILRVGTGVRCNVFYEGAKSGVERGGAVRNEIRL